MAVVVLVYNAIAQFNGFVDNKLYDTLVTATYNDVYAAVWDLIQQIVRFIYFLKIIQRCASKSMLYFSYSAVEWTPRVTGME